VHLLYLDESGKSGPGDRHQPWYVLGGVIVHESAWRGIGEELGREVDRIFPPPRDDRWEIHMADIHHRKRFFKGAPKAARERLIDAIYAVLELHQPTLIFVAIDKRTVKQHHPVEEPVEQIAYRYMLERFNFHVGRRKEGLGIVILDEQQEWERPTRRSHSRYLREGTEYASIEHVIETPFFTPSHWSPILQIADVVTYHVARKLRGEPCPQWRRIEPLLDCYPQYWGKGLKIYPEQGAADGVTGGAAHGRSPTEL